MTMTITVVDADTKSYILNPAVMSSSELYLVDDKKIIGKVRVHSKYQNTVRVGPDEPAMVEFFADRYSVKFDEILGHCKDYDDEIFCDLMIVDRLYFDMGICHKQFANIEGFDSYHKEQNRLRIHTTHKNRRRRVTHKIKNMC